jgi:chorismate synthase
MQLLGEMGITIAAHIQCIGHIRDAAFDPTAVSHEQLWALLDKPFPLLEGALETEMNKVILTAKNEGDSVGGVIEVAAVGLPAGLGDPMFDGMENRIARLVFGIPAIRGIEFGSGFDAATMRGSRHNDPWYMDGGTVRSRSNHHGGILGGITTGMPLIFRAAVKPTPSIAREQDTVSLSRGENAKLTVHGRHDPCIVPRAVPVLEAAAAIAIYDAIRCGER